MSTKNIIFSSQSAWHANFVHDKKWVKLFYNVLLAFTCILPAASVFADTLGFPPPETRRSCVNADIIGRHYKLIFLDETPKRGEAAFYNEFPNHYLAFYPNYTYSFIATRHELTDPLLLEKKLLWPLKNKRVLSFLVDKKGELLMYFDKKIRNRYNCVLVTQTTGNFKKGDIILNGYTKKAKSIVYKLYRIWY